MATYAQNAHRREVLARRRGADARDREIHRAFDLIAQDKVAKFERPVFAVTGEGSRAAQDRYRRNYDRIFPLSSRRSSAPSASGSSSGPAVAAG
jgi:hypothetical protein